MKQKTAMMELRSRLIDRSEQFRKSDMLGPFTTLTKVITEIELEFLEKEKSQIMDAWYNGFEETRPYVDHSEDYYNETYKQD